MEDKPGDNDHHINYTVDNLLVERWVLFPGIRKPYSVENIPGLVLYISQEFLPHPLGMASSVASSSNHGFADVLAPLYTSCSLCHVIDVSSLACNIQGLNVT